MYSVYGDKCRRYDFILRFKKNVILNAIEEIKGVKFIQFRILSPFPDISKEVSGKVLCIESNLGQLSLLTRSSCRVDTVAIKVNGRSIYDEEVKKL
ncbi:MAG: hypothetical protein RMH75_01455 [Archaeoglobaceae archaeon]|nr:hypothetical protein [Archaeoglobaceae archaeon]MDW7989326.1 hypothetical protein [Archaeoglobaceae archaeon]